MLQRIESYSQIGMRSCAASERSLQSIASSLSRLEVMASLTKSFSRAQVANSGENGSNELNFKRSSSLRSRDSRASSMPRVVESDYEFPGSHERRSSSGEVLYRTRRSSGESAISQKLPYTKKKFPLINQYSSFPILKRRSSTNLRQSTEWEPPPSLLELSDSEGLDISPTNSVTDSNDVHVANRAEPRYA